VKVKKSLFKSDSEVKKVKKSLFKSESESESEKSEKITFQKRN